MAFSSRLKLIVAGCVVAAVAYFGVTRVVSSYIDHKDKENFNNLNADQQKIVMQMDSAGVTKEDLRKDVKTYGEACHYMERINEDMGRCDETIGNIGTPNGVGVNRLIDNTSYYIDQLRILIKHLKEKRDDIRYLDKSGIQKTIDAAEQYIKELNAKIEGWRSMSDSRYLNLANNIMAQIKTQKDMMDKILAKRGLPRNSFENRVMYNNFSSTFDKTVLLQKQLKEAHDKASEAEKAEIQKKLDAVDELLNVMTRKLAELR
jgi:hypothetical protein